LSTFYRVCSAKLRKLWPKALQCCGSKVVASRQAKKHLLRSCWRNSSEKALRESVTENKIANPQFIYIVVEIAKMKKKLSIFLETKKKNKRINWLCRWTSSPTMSFAGHGYVVTFVNGIGKADTSDI